MQKSNYPNLELAVKTLEDLRVIYRIPENVEITKGLADRFREAKAVGYGCIDDQRAWLAVQQCLATKDPLVAFAAWYSMWLNGNISFAQMYSVNETKLGLSITLFECKPFRVELFLFEAGSFIPDHSHPDVDTFVVYVAGDLDLTKNGVSETLRQFVTCEANGVCASNGGMIRVPPGTVHGGRVNLPVPHPGLGNRFGKTQTEVDRLESLMKGGAFLTIEHWLDNWEDGSVSNNWSGNDGSTQG